MRFDKFIIYLPRTPLFHTYLIFGTQNSTQDTEKDVKTNSAATFPSDCRSIAILRLWG